MYIVTRGRRPAETLFTLEKGENCPAFWLHVTLEILYFHFVNKNIRTELVRIDTSLYNNICSYCRL